MRAYRVREIGWWCDACEKTQVGKPPSFSLWQADPDYVDYDLSNSAWTYYSQECFEEVTAWYCENCEHKYLTKPAVDALWQCGECRSYHTDEDSARSCCE